MEQSVSYHFQQTPCVIREYDITALEDNQANDFLPMEGEKWEEFVGSIREHEIYLEIE